MTWHPVRAQLGIRAFGAAAFSAREAGDLVVEPHTEQDGRGHEELYLVVEGRARFRVGDDEVEAEAGTFVFVGDPSLHREAVALEPGTSVLVLGGEPVFQPAGEEYIARVRARLDDPAAALALAEEGMRELGASPGAMYAAALARRRRETSRRRGRTCARRSPRCPASRTRRSATTCSGTSADRDPAARRLRRDQLQQRLALGLDRVARAARIVRRGGEAVEAQRGGTARRPRPSTTRARSRRRAACRSTCRSVPAARGAPAADDPRAVGVGEQHVVVLGQEARRRRRVRVGQRARRAGRTARARARRETSAAAAAGARRRRAGPSAATRSRTSATRRRTERGEVAQHDRLDVAARGRAGRRASARSAPTSACPAAATARAAAPGRAGRGTSPRRRARPASAPGQRADSRSLNSMRVSGSPASSSRPAAATCAGSTPASTSCGARPWRTPWPSPGRASPC